MFGSHLEWSEYVRDIVRERETCVVIFLADKTLHHAQLISVETATCER